MEDGEVPHFRHSVSYISGMMWLNIACPLKVVETTPTNAKFLKANNCAEICHHEPPLRTGSKYGLKLVWVGVRSRGRERPELSGVLVAD